LQEQLTGVREVNADVCAVDLFLNDQRLFGHELLRLRFSEMLVIVSPLRPKQMGSAGIFGEITVGSTHDRLP